MNRKIFILISIFTLAAACAKNPAQPNSPYNAPLTVGKQKLMVQIVSSPAEMQQGLSGRAQMSANEGMLFNFGAGTSQVPRFWMKDMKFNLDFLWIKDQKIIGITKNVAAPASATSSLPMFYPPSAVDSVLEVNAGWADGKGIKIGDAVNNNF